MTVASSRKRLLAADLRTVTLCFLLYKSLMLVVILLAPGPGYDTSTSLVAGADLNGFSISPVKLARWDAIYFLQAAKRGYVFEQEWAFSRVHSSLINRLSQLARRSPIQSSYEFNHLALWGSALSHVAHYSSVIVLYFLTAAIFRHHRNQSSLPLVSSLLHIISPAGAFFSAPYSEALFSFLNFAGFYAYVTALRQEENICLLKRDVYFILAGFLFAIATLFRSNGLLSGCLFAYDFISDALLVVTPGQIKLRRLTVLFIGGGLIFISFVIPQIIAFRQFCHNPALPRPWCHAFIPSIYEFVQKKYWGVGFLKYWRLENIPLFLLALPMLAILIVSSSTYIRLYINSMRNSITAETTTKPQSGKTRLPSNFLHNALDSYPYLFRLALPQLILACAAITNYHVQIINRISSGYPVWYWFIASLMSDQPVSAISSSSQRKSAQILIRLMMAYGLIQGVLFANFLPPA